jgi:hypothetical protein
MVNSKTSGKTYLTDESGRDKSSNGLSLVIWNLKIMELGPLVPFSEAKFSYLETDSSVLFPNFSLL